MRLVLGVFAIGALVTGAYGLYWQSKLAPIMNDPGVRLVPERLGLPDIEEGHAVDLGFAEFRLPHSLRGSLVRHDDSLFVSVAENPGADVSLTIGPPVFEDDPDIILLLEQYEQLSGIKPASYHDLERLILSVEPFSVWSIPFRSVQESIRDATLLALKSLVTSGATRLLFYEDVRFQIVVTIRPELVEVKLTEKAQAVSQAFLLADSNTPAEMLAAHLAASYRFKSAERSPDQLLAQLAATGMEQRIWTPTGDQKTEDERLQEVANAVRDRRLKRTQPPSN